MKNYQNTAGIAEESGNTPVAGSSIAQAINQLIRYELNQFYEHFKDENLRSLLEAFFCRKLVACDWRARLEGSTDSRTLARLICASDVLIECSIYSPQAGRLEPVSFNSASTYAIWALDHLAQCIEAPPDLKESLGEPPLTDEELRQLALIEADMQGEELAKSARLVAIQSDVLRDAFQSDVLRHRFP